MSEPELNFDKGRVGRLVSELIAAGPDGTQASLTRAVGASGPTVNRWSKRQLNPDQKYWRAIEEFFDLSTGTLIAAALGISGGSDRAIIASLLEQALGKATNSVTKSESIVIAKLVEELRRSGDSSAK